jgi:hypothetical protein
MIQRDVTPAELDWIIRQSLSTPHDLASALFADAMFCDFSAELTALSAAVPTKYVIAEHWAATAVAYMNFNASLAAFIEQAACTRGCAGVGGCEWRAADASCILHSAFALGSYAARFDRRAIVW